MNKKLSPERYALIAALNAADGPLSPAGLARVMGREREPVKKLLYACVKDGLVLSSGDGRYAVKEHVMHAFEREADRGAFEHEGRVSGADSPYSGTEKPGRGPEAGTEEGPARAADSSTVAGYVANITVAAESGLSKPYLGGGMSVYWAGEANEEPRIRPLERNDYGALRPKPGT